MNAIFRISILVLKYLVNIGPLIYEGTRLGIRIVKEIRSGKKVSKVEEVVSDKPSPASKADFDPG
ncbi:MAG: hypothetical protein D4R64_14695 [Porphyromonadaceae bacterium]|nr:MAG: hypothetical protein D4R64_14695 [Porphyromonadaceae bacterium]